MALGSGITMILAGLLVVTIVGGFFGYGFYARGKLAESITISVTQIPGGNPTIPAVEKMLDPQSDLNPKPTESTLQPPYWSDPRWDWSVEEKELLSKFIPISEIQYAYLGTNSPKRLKVPAINLDAEIIPLGIQDLGDVRQYETPPFAVGHIPESSKPGETGVTWLFGHLESPIRGEGSIFRDLPSLYALLQVGRPLYAIVETTGDSFLYQLRNFEKVEAADLRLSSSPEKLVRLVTCWPPYIYDQRIIVTGELIGIRLSPGLDTPVRTS